MNILSASNEQRVCVGQQSSSEHAGCVVENTASMQVAAEVCDANQVLVEAVVLSLQDTSSNGDEAGTVGARVVRRRPASAPPPPH